MASVALVTGANRGIGYEVVRQLADLGHTVVLTSRDPAKGSAAAAGLDRVRYCQLDVSDPVSVEAMAQWVGDRFDRVDVLVNNAAIHYDTWQSGVGADLGVVHEAFETNFFGAWRTTQSRVPLLLRSGHGRIVNVSSEGGSLASMGGGTPAYSTSKAALNALTRILADELRRDRILVNAVCPGWTDTDMGQGGRPVSEGAAGVVAREEARRRPLWSCEQRLPVEARWPKQIGRAHV